MAEITTTSAGSNPSSVDPQRANRGLRKMGEPGEAESGKLPRIGEALERQRASRVGESREAEGNLPKIGDLKVSADSGLPRMGDDGRGARIDLLA